MRERKLSHKGRAVIVQKYDGLEITIPNERNLFIVAFLCFWLCGWVMGEVAVITTLIKGKAAFPLMLFMLFWLAGWTVGGFFAVTAVLAMLIGKEIIGITSYKISIAGRIGPWGPTAAYNTSAVKNLRIIQVSQEGKPRFPSPNSSHTVTASTVLAFEYEGKTVEFASSLKTGEQQALLEMLRKSGYLREGNFPVKPGNEGDCPGAEEDRLYVYRD
jgi:hypothetical protein